MTENLQMEKSKKYVKLFGLMTADGLLMLCLAKLFMSYGNLLSKRRMSGKQSLVLFVEEISVLKKGSKN